MVQEECSLQRMDQDQAICSLSTLICSEAKEVASVLLSVVVEVDSMIHLADQDEEEAASDQAGAVWVAALVQEVASVEAVALEVDLVVLDDR